MWSDYSTPLKPLFGASGIMAGLLLIAGCADSRGGPIPYDQPMAAPDEPRIVALESNYKIAPMDQLGIKIFKSEDLTGDYEVDLAGRISLPLIGEIQAANLTTAQLDEKLTKSSARNTSRTPTSPCRSSGRRRESSRLTGRSANPDRFRSPAR